MPNWCSNNATIVADSADAIEKMKEFKTMIDERKADKGSDWDGSKNLLFNSFVTRPKEEEKNWYNWNTANWGTKWDADLYEITFDEEDNSFCCYFMTAWCPPITFYETMEEMGFCVDAQYNEDGMGFFGRFANGYDRHREDSDIDTDEIQDAVIRYNTEDACADEYDVTNKEKGDLIYDEKDGKSIPLFLYVQKQEYTHLELFKDILGDWLEEDLEASPKYREGILDQPEDKKYIVCKLLDIGEQYISYGIIEDNTIFRFDW